MGFDHQDRAASPTSPAHVVAGALVRCPRAVPEWEPTELTSPPAPPAAPESAGGLVPALLGLVGAGAVALAMRQPMFLLFGALGGLVAIGSWVAQRLAARRRRRRELAAHDHDCRLHQAAVLRERERAREFHLARVPTVGTARQTIASRSAALWSRRAGHPDAFIAALGVGDLPWPDAADGTPAAGAGGRLNDAGRGVAVGREVHDVPLPVDLGPGARLALSGPHSDAVLRSLVVQLTASCGPADLRIVVVTDRPDIWEWARGLPHLAQPDGEVAIIGESRLGALLAELGDGPAHLLVVTDQPSALAARTSPLRRALTDPLRHALVTLLPPGAGVPHLCTSVLTTVVGPVGRWVADTRITMLPVPVRIAGLGERAAFACTASLRSLVDPEDPASVATGVPRELSLSTLLAAESGTSLAPAGIVATWLAAGADPSPRTLIGMAADGAVDIDLVRDGPHGLIAGTTGAGKSELLRSLVAGMAAGSSPAHTSFLLVDYKGGATFDACAALPHVVGVITDLDDRLADRALRSLHAELRRREGILRDHGATDLPALRSEAPHVLLPRLVVVIDEFAALVAEQPGFLHALVGVAQRGRSLGVHLLLATQRPGGVISDDIRANTNLRLALRLQDTADAIDVVGVPSPAMLPRGLPGRAVMRLGADDHLTFQTARCTAAVTTGGETELQVLVRSIGEAARLAGSPPPPAPWQEPLPATLGPDEVPVGALGLVDDPDRQRTVPLRWAPGDGHLLIAGSPGAGVTSTVHTLAVHALTASPSGAGEEVEVYVLDGRGGELLAGLAEHPRCVAVVRLHERERLMRLLHRLRTLARARLAGGPRAGVVWCIDGLDALRRTLDDVETAAEFDALEEVLADAEAAGISIVAGVEHAAAVPARLLANCPHRWVMHLVDPHDAGLLGVAASRVPPAGVPGRLFVAASGLVGHVVHIDRQPLRVDGHEPVRRSPAITVVPAVVTDARLSAGTAADRTTALPLGIDFASGDPQALHLPDGEHVLVIGGARSGRSTTLARLATAWEQSHPGGWVGAIVPRSSSSLVAPEMAADTTLLDRMPGNGPALLVVDDAEAVDDLDGRLAALAGGGRPATWVFVAGRPDALRQLYGHWTSVVRRSRIGLVHTGGSDLDGDLLGVALPRRTPVAPRPGLAWLVCNGEVRLTQLAVPAAASVEGATTGATTGASTRAGS
ncbi:MAG: FtsK/SpoIIIE domain-containing protein [Ilumatobacteraceae bacterium]